MSLVRKIKSCRFLVLISLWDFLLRFLPYSCSDWFCFGLCPNTCFLSAWNRLYWWEMLIMVDFVYQNLNVIFYSYIKEPRGLVCLKSLCGTFVVFYLERSLCDGLLANGRKFGISFQMWDVALWSEYRLSWNCAGVLFVFPSQRVWVLQLVALILVPRVVISLTSMCRGILRKQWFIAVTSFRHVYLCSVKMSVVWKTERNGCPEGNRNSDVDIICIFWKRG